MRAWVRKTIDKEGSMNLVVFSHLRWDFVFQRPQHLLSRLSRHHPVVYIEEPVFDAGEPFLEEIEAAAQVRVLRPHTPVHAPGFHDDQLPFLEPLIEHWLERNRIGDYVVWFYTPMALPLMADLTPSAVVYDCMDELSSFKGAPRQMLQREASLLRRADLVLTGGPSLYEAKRTANPYVLCLPSAVDAAHFARDNALAKADLVARAEELQGAIAHPRLGYYGVIDERLDLDLLKSVAQAEPSWQLVMVGPVAKIDPADLPRAPNIHWLGQQSYDLLPQLVAGWDVCLMPFALNEATRHISPTKTLEYMAAGRAVVSTAVQDVITLYGDAVRVAENRAAFLGGIRDALAETPRQRAERRERMRQSVARFSWDGTADVIRQALETAVRQAQTQRLFQDDRRVQGTGHRAA
jgi:glycosyltransferase involved in cell wall biosynthesis